MSLDMEAVEFLKRKQCAKCGGSGQVAVTGFITHSSGRCVCEMPDYNCTPFVHRANILDTPDNGYDHARKILAELEGK